MSDRLSNSNSPQKPPIKIAFLVSDFPVLSETFILNQIVGMIDRCCDVDIYAERCGNRDKVHPLVEKYDLQKHTYYLPELPENYFLISRFIVCSSESYSVKDIWAESDVLEISEI